MASSVQELILAAKSKRSPLLSLLEGFAGGVGKAISPEGVKARMEAEQQRMDIEGQARMREEYDAEIARATEGKTQEGLKAAGAAPSPVHPAQKVRKVSWSTDEKGRRSKVETFEAVDPSHGTGEQFYTDPETGMKFRIKPGHKGNEMIPLPGQAIGPDGNVVFTASDKNASYQFVGLQDGKPVLLNPKTGQMQLGELPGQGSLTPKTQTEGQANAKLYATRMEESHGQINEIAGKVDLASTSSAARGALPNVAKSKEIQMYEQAKRNFLNAVLRRESGAVISPAESAEGNRQYFPVFGDKPETIEQKRKNRDTAIAGLKNASGVSVDVSTPLATPPVPRPGATAWTSDDEARLAELERKRSQGGLR